MITREAVDKLMDDLGESISEDIKEMSEEKLTAFKEGLQRMVNIAAKKAATRVERPTKTETPLRKLRTMAVVAAYVLYSELYASIDEVLEEKER